MFSVFACCCLFVLCESFVRCGLMLHGVLCVMVSVVRVRFKQRVCAIVWCCVACRLLCLFCVCECLNCACLTTSLCDLCVMHCVTMCGLSAVRYVFCVCVLCVCCCVCVFVCLVCVGVCVLCLCVFFASYCVMLSVFVCFVVLVCAF